MSLSRASTVSGDEISQEPFDSWKDRVLKWAQDQWKLTARDELEIKHVAGGVNNRITYISLWRPGQLFKVEYMLRAPRMYTSSIEQSQANWEESRAAWMEEQVAALQYVRQLGSIPVPDIFAFDTQKKNALGTCYMVQTRLPGVPLGLSPHNNWNPIYLALDHSRHLRIATEIGHIVRSMLSAKDKKIGQFHFLNDFSGLGNYPRQAVVMPDLGALTDSSGSKYDVQGMLNILLDGGLRGEIETDVRLDVYGALMRRCISMATELDFDGWLDVPLALSHKDFNPQNILINPEAGAHEAIVTGIIDWDSACMQPIFMACEIPYWLWERNWGGYHHADDWMAQEVPLDMQSRAIKLAFEEAAGPEFRHYAYSPVYRLARQLMRVTVYGIASVDQVEELRKMCDEWHLLRQQQHNEVMSRLVQSLEALEL